MGVEFDELAIYNGPLMHGAPDSLREVVLKVIERADVRTFVATQQLEHFEVVEALLEAKGRGVNVRVMLEYDFLTERSAAIDPWQQVIGGNEINRELMAVLLRARVPIRLDRASTLLHSNFVVTEKEVMMTSANLAESGLEDNYNSAVVMRTADAIAVFQEEFIRLWEGPEGEPSEEAPEIDHSQVRVKVVFGPRHAPEMELMKQILKAVDRLDIAIFTFSHSSGIDDALIAAAQRDVAVRVVIDTDQALQQWSPVPQLRDAGIQLFHIGGAGNRLHHKLVVVDDAVTVAGTFNFTKSARSSHESVLVLGTVQPDISDEARRRQEQISHFARAEIERLAARGEPL